MKNLYTLQYFIDEELIGSTSMPTFTYMGFNGNIPMPITYICPKCGDGWAKRIVFGGGIFRANCSNLCPHCGPGFLFLQHEPDVYILHAPTTVLQRELQLITLLKNSTDYGEPFTGQLEKLCVFNS